MLFAGDATGNEDSQVADCVMNRIDNRLSIGANFVDVLIEVEDPA
jgi:hypothetical protein